MKKLTQEDYIEKCKEIHNNKYDYSLVEYKNSRKRIKIICSEHGIFEQLSKAHKEGQGCPKCSAINYKLTKLEFINKCNLDKYDYKYLDEIIKIRKIIRVVDKHTELIYQQYAQHHLNGLSPTKIESESLINRLKIIHNNKYDYFIKNETVRNTEKIKLIDNISKDEFLYRVDRHLQGMSPNKVTVNRFKIKSAEIHNNKYDYSLIREIKGNNDKVKIVCREHGIFEQRVSNHMNLKDGCPKCSKYDKWVKEELISEFKRIHFDKYNYSLVDFKSVSEKIKIICPKHGEFLQNINKHLSGQGCKFCKSLSKGEDYIKIYLDENKIKYIRQHGFDTCKYINRLNFDFYLPDYEMCIEFDGIQHFEIVKKFGGNKEFIDCQNRDNSKNKWCLENNMKLIRIKYNEIDKISEILKNYLNCNIKNSPMPYPS